MREVGEGWLGGILRWLGRFLFAAYGDICVRVTEINGWEVREELIVSEELKINRARTKFYKNIDTSVMNNL